MAVKVTWIADIVGSKIIMSDQRKYKAGDIAAILTNINQTSDPDPEFQWKLEIVIGVGPTERRVVIDLPCMINKSDCLDNPLFLGDGRVVYFRHRLYLPFRLPMNTSECEEIVLRVKKAVFNDETDIVNLRSAVANLEAALKFKKSGPKRTAIPEDVKLFVWARDSGSCIRCGSIKNLHFDHIIPVSKGGGNSEKNIQILCNHCNLKKSDKISF